MRRLTLVILLDLIVVTRRSSRRARRWRRGSPAVALAGLAVIAGGIALAACGGGSSDDACAGIPRSGLHGDALVLTGPLSRAGGRIDRATLCRTLGRPDDVEDVSGGERWTYARRGDRGLFMLGDDGRVSGSGARFTPRSGSNQP